MIDDLKLAPSVSVDRALSLIAAEPCLGARAAGELGGAHPWRKFPSDWDDNPPLLFDLESVGW
jgi:hypothetical protein